jgi:phospholipase C
MPPGLDNLKHIVVLMMENRSFDHMLGALKAQDPRIDGLTGNESNPDTTGATVKVASKAQFQSQLDPDPDHHFPGVDLQIFNGDNSNPRVPNMQGFIKSYFQQQRDVKHSQKIMYYFTPDKLPVLTTLATEFAVFNGWFSSIPGPTICNRAFAHYGTSFGKVGMDLFYAKEPFKSIYDRMVTANPARTSKLYYYDQASSTMEIVNLLQHQSELFGTYDQFIADCSKGTLPDYSFVEPNYNDHDGDAGAIIASDQHPDHHVQEGERFIASVYNAIRQNPGLWKTTALLVVYDEHGGIYDHVLPPACMKDGFVAQPNDTGTGRAFEFDRLGVRVPAILISPWIAKGTVVKGPQEPGGGRTFEHASIPATVTKFFLGDYDQRSPREKAADTFLDLLTLPQMRDDTPEFQLD